MGNFSHFLISKFNPTNFGVLTYQLEEMRDLMLHHHVVEVSMESTSVYWIPIWRVLSPHFKLNLANPYFIKQLSGRKSDVKDAQWIAECTTKELIRGSFVPHFNYTDV